MILIVEDNQTICNGLKKVVLEIDSSSEVITTGYAAQGLQYANAMEVKLFILDIRLLDYSGIELGKQIRAIQRYMLTPIVFITSNVHAELETFRETQCYRFIQKPFVLSDVKAVLKPLIMNEGSQGGSAKKLQLKQKGYALSVKQEDILYLEASNRKILVVTRQETISLCTYTLQGLKTELSEAFIQCHKGFVVNTKWISKIDRIQNQIHLLGSDSVIPLGEKYRDVMTGAWV